VHKTHEELFTSTNDWLIHELNKTKVNALFLPAGNTLKPLYKRWRGGNFPPQLKNFRLLQLDEIIEGEKQGIFQFFFKQELPELSVEAPSEKAYEGTAIAILGLGMNGHIAFHEPELPPDFSFGTVALSQGSAQNLGVTPGTKACSYGLGTFLRLPSLLLVVTGEKKQEIFSRLLKQDPALPATQLLKHPNLTIFCDSSLGKNSPKIT